ncbi:GNAT family N-acetyltransferase [Actinopolymorpha pittospori]|uniref:RimJ/RimL family protein N-acetyltransferase/8-oxo-dGTP pyrophosphatase MutT (NUDIX family) n=1 Tax=Actinopolymorpha pittospori TaxID=648752 RepID=A0A927MS75_9ACTN|nr:GNAT family N-acetyltransferase [Actinopolymorpha pittospori]MBE1605174.1 RimJ/RimL family protein N-acetyltransferase/8-oxo-dGTP pyrophosphatase MutT (NUDIX family) [Actinopolymorpha pittospori]
MGILDDHLALTPPAQEGSALRVTALIRDSRHRVFVRRLLPSDSRPGGWEAVGRDVPAGESAGAVLVRAVAEETGWTLGQVEALLDDRERRDGAHRLRDLAFLVRVDGDLTAPRLAEGRYDAHGWVGVRDLGPFRTGGTQGRTRGGHALTERPDQELAGEGADGRRGDGHRTDGEQGDRHRTSGERGDGDSIDGAPADAATAEVVVKAARTRLSARLRLEPVGPEHSEDLWRLHVHPDVAAWLGGPWTQEVARRSAVRVRAGWDAAGAGIWVAYDRVTGELVGRGGLAPYSLDGLATYEVGWIVHPDRWGQGYATEMGMAGLEFAFQELGAREVVAFTLPHNTRSRAVMDRLGMRYDREIVHAGMGHVLYVRRNPAADDNGRNRPYSRHDEDSGTSRI